MGTCSDDKRHTSGYDPFVKPFRWSQEKNDLVAAELGIISMPRTDDYEDGLLSAYERGELRSVATKEEMARLRAAARATGIKDKRVNVRLSSGDLRDIQIRALKEGIPYQTLIASVLHKYVTGRLVERNASDT